MNYRAHPLLSGEDTEILIGNMAGDSIKGKIPLGLFPPKVETGLRLHKVIDACTDMSAEFSICKQIFTGDYSRPAHALTDVAFDHILCASWPRYCKIPLNTFTKNVYHRMQTHYHLLPHAFLPVFKRMVEENWLLSYKSLDGIAKAYERIAMRLGLPPGKFKNATRVIESYYPLLSEQFNILFPRVILETKKFLESQLTFI